MEAIVARGGQPTLRSVAAETGLAYGTVYYHGHLLDARYGDAPQPGLGPQDKESIEGRIAVVREAKLRRAVLGGLDKRALDEILPD